MLRGLLCRAHHGAKYQSTGSRVTRPLARETSTTGVGSAGLGRHDVGGARLCRPIQNEVVLRPSGEFLACDISRVRFRHILAVGGQSTAHIETGDGDGMCCVVSVGVRMYTAIALEPGGCLALLFMGVTRGSL